MKFDPSQLKPELKIAANCKHVYDTAFDEGYGKYGHRWKCCYRGWISEFLQPCWACGLFKAIKQ